MRGSQDFRETIRRGVRTAKPTVVVHARATSDEPESLVGFVVSKAVGNAVARNRVKRRLRHLMRPLVARHPCGLNVVVRALPASATMPERLAADVHNGWQTSLKRLGIDDGETA